MRARGELKTTLQPLRDSRIDTEYPDSDLDPLARRLLSPYKPAPLFRSVPIMLCPPFGYPLSAGAAGVCGNGSGHGAAGRNAGGGCRACTSSFPAGGPRGSTITEFGNPPTRQSAATRPDILRAARFLSIGRSQFGAGAIPALYRRVERCGLGCEDLRCADRPRRQTGQLGFDHLRFRTAGIALHRYGGGAARHRRNSRRRFTISKLGW